MKNLKDKLNDALVKKAMGYSVEESVCEYGMCDDELKLIKKKISKKYYPPDLSAINLLIGSVNKSDFETMTDEELEQEKNRLLKLLKENENGDKKE